MTTCYDCGKAFDLSPADVFYLVGYGDFCIEETDISHLLVNIDNGREAVLEHISA